MVNIAPQKNGDDLGMFIPLAYHMDPYELDDLVVPVTRSTAFRWPCVFLIHGKLPMILDVLVSVGFCVILA